MIFLGINSFDFAYVSVFKIREKKTACNFFEQSFCDFHDNTNNYFQIVLFIPCQQEKK